MGVLSSDHPQTRTNQRWASEVDVDVHALNGMPEPGGPISVRTD